MRQEQSYTTLAVVLPAPNQTQSRYRLYCDCGRLSLISQRRIWVDTHLSMALPPSLHRTHPAPAPATAIRARSVPPYAFVQYRHTRSFGTAIRARSVPPSTRYPPYALTRYRHTHHTPWLSTAIRPIRPGSVPPSSTAPHRSTLTQRRTHTHSEKPTHTTPQYQDTHRTQQSAFSYLVSGSVADLRRQRFEPSPPPRTDTRTLRSPRRSPVCTATEP